MLEAGFLASPLQLDNRDVMDLYTGAPVTHPVAYSVEPKAGTEALWDPAISVRIYKIENQLGNSVSSALSKLLDFPGFEVAPTEVVSPVHSIIHIGGKPVLLLPPGGYMRFTAPAGAKELKGNFGFAPASYLLTGATEGAEFRIEEELSDGTHRLLYTRTLKPTTNPDDRGMKAFSVPCRGAGERKFVVRAERVSAVPSRWDLTCWAEIGFR